MLPDGESKKTEIASFQHLSYYNFEKKAITKNLFKTLFTQFINACLAIHNGNISNTVEPHKLETLCTSDISNFGKVLISGHLFFTDNYNKNSYVCFILKQNNF